MKFVKKSKQLVPTTEFKVLKFGFSYFNPIQSAVFPYFESSHNIIVASGTATGKTEIALAMFSVALKKKRKCIYTSPMKALSSEKFEDWKKRFPKKEVIIVTGDYRGNISKLKDADILVMTSEMLDSRSRGDISWVNDVGCLVIDEAHMIGVEGRGDRVEAALVRFLTRNPSVRVGMLSATCSNVRELTAWIESLSKNRCVYAKSKWRPVKLQKEYMMYDNESDLVTRVVGKVNEYAYDEKVLVFVHTKAMGRNVVYRLQRAGIITAFHEASVPLQKRKELEGRFRNDNSGFNVLVATSTLAMGVNLPASVVIVCGVKRGPRYVSSTEIEQEVGRCGRVFADKLEEYVKRHVDRPRIEVEREYLNSIKGKAFLFIPRGDSYKQMNRLADDKSMLVESVLPEEMMFHVVAEVKGGANTIVLLKQWYEKTFAYYQNRIVIFEDVIEKLVEIKAVRVKRGKIELRNLGKIACIFYYNPLDLYGVMMNLNRFFGSRSMDDAYISWSISDLPMNFQTINSEERKAVGDYKRQIASLGLKHHSMGSEKIGSVFYNLMNGIKLDPCLRHFAMQHLSDLDRFMGAVRRTVTLCTTWKNDEFFARLLIRIRYGVTWKEAEFCSEKGIGKVIAGQLVRLGYKTMEDVTEDKENAIRNIPRLKKILGG